MEKISLTICILFIVSAAAVANADEVCTPELKLDATIEYVQKYMWRGIDWQNNDTAIQMDLYLDLYDTGFYVDIWGSYAPDEEWEDYDETDLCIGYGCSFWEGKRYAIDVDGSYTYFYYRRLERVDDSKEAGLTLKFPKLLPIGQSCLVPYTGFYYGWAMPLDDSDVVWTKLGVSYDFKVPVLLHGQEEQTVSVYAESFYNDGYESVNLDSGWNHIAAGLSTTFTWREIGFTPGINYQWDLGVTENNDYVEDEFWYSFAVSFSFS